MQIIELPLSETFRITVFSGRQDYSLSREGWILYHNGTAVENNFANRRVYFKSHKLYKFNKLTESILEDFYADANLEIEGSKLDHFTNFLKENGIENFDEKLHIIAPKTSKKLSGKIHLIEFSVGALDFGYGSTIQELEVFVTPITKTSKSVKYSMFIPKFLYDKCMLNPDVKERPLNKYIEASTLSVLHDSISSLVSKAHCLWEIEKEAKDAKKVLCINFNSAETLTRDSYNHAYTGQRIDTKFNFFVAYKTTNNSLFTFIKYQTGMGSTEKGVSGLIDTSLKGDRQWVKATTPDVIIDWTKEREEFLLLLESKFRNLSEDLNKFLKDLDENKLQMLIDNQSTLKLLQ